LRRLKKENAPFPVVFTGNRHAPLSQRSISHIVHQAGILAGFEFPVHPSLAPCLWVLFGE